MKIASKIHGKFVFPLQSHYMIKFMIIITIYDLQSIPFWFPIWFPENIQVPGWRRIEEGRKLDCVGRCVVMLNKIPVSISDHKKICQENWFRELCVQCIHTLTKLLGWKVFHLASESYSHKNVTHVHHSVKARDRKWVS